VRYEVLLHGMNLVLLDEAGAKRIGGIYAWRFVEADDESMAAARAKEALLGDPEFLIDLWNESTEEISWEVDEICLQAEGTPDKVVGGVFYIDDLE
jgi:hypothetical protein